MLLLANRAALQPCVSEMDGGLAALCCDRPVLRIETTSSIGRKENDPSNGRCFGSSSGSRTMERANRSSPVAQNGPAFGHAPAFCIQLCIRH